MRPDEVKLTGKFIWGRIVKWHKLGPYEILEYNPWVVDGCIIRRGVPSEKTSYHGWTDGEDANESWPTLETCICGLIGKKWGGNNNGGVGYYFCKMIDAPPYNVR